jgi:hypothetical protein
MLNLVSFAYNTTVCDAFETTPFYLNHGGHATEPMDLVYGEKDTEEIKKDVTRYGRDVPHRLQKAYRIVRRNQFQVRQAARHKRGAARRKDYYAVGDHVFRLRACPVLDGTDLFDVLHGAGHHDDIRSAPGRYRSALFQGLLPPTGDELKQAEEELAEWLSPRRERYGNQLRQRGQRLK